MTTSHLPYQPGRREQFATRICFLIAGTGIAAWAPLVPLVKARLALTDDVLGLLLLMIGTGALLSMPVSGMLATRFGCRKVITAGMLLFTFSLGMLMLLPPSILLTGIVLFLFGVGAGTLDCAANIQALIVEQASGKRLMSGFHGQYSLGGIVGAAVMTGLMALGLGPAASMLLICGVALLAYFFLLPGLLTYGSKKESTGFMFPRGIVLLIGCLCFITFMLEGALLDWGALLMTTVQDIPKEYAGVAFVAFSITMTAGRLMGDRIVGRIGSPIILAAGGIIAIIGILVIALTPSWQLALAGFALIGAGASNIVPVMFSEVGRQKVMPENIAVPTVFSMGYAGILLGPAGIGVLSHATSLPTAFIVIAGLMLLIVGCSRLFRS